MFTVWVKEQRLSMPRRFIKFFLLAALVAFIIVNAIVLVFKPNPIAAELIGIGFGLCPVVFAFYMTWNDEA